MSVNKAKTVKVSVENIESKEQILYEINLEKSLEENIRDISEKFQKPQSSVYGLKLISQKDGKPLHTYITDANFEKCLEDGCFLKLVYSLDYYVKRIFDHISDKYKERSFQDLYELSVDPEFIKEIVKNEKQLILFEVFTTSELSESEATACLMAITHLFQKLYISDISLEFLNKVIFLAKNAQNSELLKYSLSVIYKILCHRDAAFSKWKEEVIQQVTILDLITMIKTRRTSDLQYACLLLINGMVRCCKGEKRKQLIKEIDKKSVREAIYEHTIANGSPDKQLAHELYIYQTNLLSQFAETLNTPIEIDDSLNKEFEPQECEVKKMTILMDFDETTKNKSASVENLLDYSDIRISLASMSSMYSEDSRYSSRIQSTVTEHSDYDSMKPSLLTVEALRHYQKYHFKNFNQSQIEEKIYSPGIILSAERVVRMLAKILCIGTEPDKNGICYQPSIFLCSSKTPFFFELFSRTMWLLSKTRREMKASTLQDYEKVIYILGKQVKLVLEKKVVDFKKLTEEFCLTNYQKVMEIWQKEKDKELESTLKENPSVQIVKKSFKEINTEIVHRQRLNYIKAGTLFPKFNDKKINGNFYAKLSNDNRSLLINDYNVTAKVKGDVQSYLIADIAYIVENKACPHVKNNSVKDPTLAFSILLKNDTWINFKAADRKSAAYWLDALNFLLGKGNNRSKYFDAELDELVKMDLVLYLIELQTVPIPKRAPPVPKLPFEIKPLVPPKPRHLPIKK